MSDLTILTVTDGGHHAQPFVDAMEQLAGDLGATFVEYDGTCCDCIENVLDQAVADCPDGYILRLDDDERCTTAMVEWLYAGAYRAADHWAFPRYNLWPNENAHILSHGLFPDLQTRLSVKAKAGGRTRVHQGSPFGTGEQAPVALEHWKFLVRPLDERRALLARYEALQPGAGGPQFAAFSVPEDADELVVVPYRAEVAA